MNLIESPINYMGSKYKLLNRLIPLFPEADTFVDLFAGGGSVYMNVNHLYKNVLAIAKKEKTNTEYYFTNVF